ncbi:MAG: hypothetical protein D6725_06935 [Planctomycetota bacterium]|nr:MAG: hypothetical protein D6725_06935 [Planctomycetota bacterium]
MWVIRLQAQGRIHVPVCGRPAAGFGVELGQPDPGDADPVTPGDLVPAGAQAAVPQPEISAEAGSARSRAANALADWPDRFLEQLAQYRFDPHWQAYRAAELARFGRLDAAIRTMQRVVQEVPDEPLFAGALVRLLVRAKRLAEAERVVDEARREHPEDFELLRLAATVRLLQGDAAAADPLLRRAIDQKPDNAAVRYDRALALLAMKRRDEALQELEAAVRVDPAFFDAWFALANERLADGEIEAARRCLENALRLRPDDARVLGLQRRIQRP